MRIELKFKFIWIPTSLGGHHGLPYEGMRTTIRWQKYLSDSLKYSHDAQWEKIVYNRESLRGEAICSLISPDKLPDECFLDGALIEMLSGYRVLAVGQISN